MIMSQINSYTFYQTISQMQEGLSKLSNISEKKDDLKAMLKLRKTFSRKPQENYLHFLKKK